MGYGGWFWFVEWLCVDECYFLVWYCGVGVVVCVYVVCGGVCCVDYCFVFCVVCLFFVGCGGGFVVWFCFCVFGDVWLV